MPVSSVRDVNGQAATVTYDYDAIANLTSTNAAGVVTTLSYDARGRKTGMVDPDMGIWSYGYNAFGELITQTDAKNQTTTLAYDALGRMTSRVELEGTTTWAYDTGTYAKGKLVSVSAPGGYSETYSYDTPVTETGSAVTKRFAFDAWGKRINPANGPPKPRPIEHRRAQLQTR